MRNIQVCRDVGTLFIDRDGTTVLLEIRVYRYLSLLRLGTRLMYNTFTTVLSTGLLCMGFRSMKKLE